MLCHTNEPCDQSLSQNHLGIRHFTTLLLQQELCSSHLLLAVFFWVLGIFNRPVMKCWCTGVSYQNWTLKHCLIPVRYSGSGTGSDSSSWHWASVGTDATTMPSGSCCSMPLAKFFCLMWGERQQEGLFRDTGTRSSNMWSERGDKERVREVKKSDEAKVGS